MFLSFLLSWIKANIANSDAVQKKISDEWDGWVYTPGKPPVTLDFHTEAID
jgi:hypothetical protein